MRVLAIADVHGNHDTYRWVMTTAAQRGADAVVLAGDLLGYPDGFDTVEEAQRADAIRILSILSDPATPVLYIMGNDDEVEMESPAGDERIRSIHRRRVDLGRYNFVGYQHSLPFMGGINEKTEEGIAEDIATLEDFVDERTVLVTHSPAAGALDVALGFTGQTEHSGSVSIAGLVRRRNVRAHIHGHVHHWFGRDGRHFNVAAGRVRRAMLIDLDTLDHEILRS